MISDNWRELNMYNLNIDQLLEIYQDAIKHNVSEDFITLLVNEINNRRDGEFLNIEYKETMPK